MNTGMMATYPDRKDSLTEMLQTVFPQLDKLYIYCNQYSRANLLELNHWVLHHSGSCQVCIIDSNDSEGDVQDMGKFWALGTNLEGYAFLLDDDLLYPADYCERHIKTINLHQAVSTVHGRIIRRQPITNYFGGTRSFHYRQNLSKPRKVHIAGTGTCAFQAEWFSEVHASTISMLKYQGMADIWFACQVNWLGIKIMSMPRKSGWLTDTPSSKQSSSLYRQTKEDDSRHCEILNKWTWD